MRTFEEIRKTKPTEFKGKMNMRMTVEKRAFDYVSKMNVHYSALVKYHDELASIWTGCGLTELWGEIERSRATAKEFLERMRGVVDGLRLAGVNVTLEEETIVRGLVLYTVEQV